MHCIFSIDVEDWFHILDLPTTPEAGEWDRLESRVEKNFIRLLDLLDTHECKATCFFLAWIAKKFPHLVREAHTRGHEIASHGCSHQLVYRMTRDEFLVDARESRETIEDILSGAVTGFRATGFSVTEETPWFFDCLSEAGYMYDSSVFPATRGHGGIRSGRLEPHKIVTSSGTIVELPITVATLPGKRICLFGGGYLRLAPYFLIDYAAKRILRRGRPVIFYFHPREVDPGQPRLAMNPVRRFKSYVNIDSAEKKLGRLLHEFKTITCSEYIARENITGEVSA